MCVDKFERVQKRALRFVYGQQMPEAPKNELLIIPQQLAYLIFFRKYLDGDAKIDGMARIGRGRVMRNSDVEHRLIPPKARTDNGTASTLSFRLATQ